MRRRDRPAWRESFEADHRSGGHLIPTAGPSRSLAGAVPGDFLDSSQPQQLAYRRSVEYQRESPLVMRRSFLPPAHRPVVVSVLLPVVSLSRLPWSGGGLSAVSSDGCAERERSPRTGIETAVDTQGRDSGTSAQPIALIVSGLANTTSALSARLARRTNVVLRPSRHASFVAQSATCTVTFTDVNVTGRQDFAKERALGLRASVDRRAGVQGPRPRHPAPSDRGLLQEARPSCSWTC